MRILHSLLLTLIFKIGSTNGFVLPQPQARPMRLFNRYWDDYSNDFRDDYRMDNYESYRDEFYRFNDPRPVTWDCLGGGSMSYVQDRSPERFPLQNRGDRYIDDYDDWRDDHINTIHGDARQTWESHPDNDLNRVVMETDGRVLDAEFEVYDGPDDTPTKVRVQSEDGRTHPFNGIFRSGSRSGSGSYSVRNKGGATFPMRAGVGSVNTYSGGSVDYSNMRTVQGQCLKTWSFDDSVESVQITIVTNGLPMLASIELWGVGGQVKQVADIYNDDGSDRPFSTIIETPGRSNSICIRNTGSMEFPFSASCEVHTVY